MDRDERRSSLVSRTAGEALRQVPAQGLSWRRRHGDRGRGRSCSPPTEEADRRRLGWSGVVRKWLNSAACQPACQGVALCHAAVCSDCLLRQSGWAARRELACMHA